MKYLRTEIQKLLVTTAMAATFPSITYDTNHVPQVGANVQPAEALANEIDSDFGIAELQRRSYQRDITRWVFELRLNFNQEVLLEEFQAALLRSPPRIDKDPANGIMRSVLLDLTRCTPVHPVQQQPSAGTHAVCTFEARLSPA